MMAAIIGPDMMTADPVSRNGRSHNPRHLSIPILRDTVDFPEPALDMPQLSPRSQAAPPPNPHFVFPARPASVSAPSSYSRATGRRPRSAIETQQQPFGAFRNNDTRPLGSPALPNFTFNPGASLAPIPVTPTTDTFLSPSQPAQSPRLSPARAGHRRGGSEFVGGEYRSGSARVEVLSSSPTRSDSGMASPPLMPVDSRPRGPAQHHMHRRSAAMSSHDLSSITLPKTPNMPTRGNSAPSSPSASELNQAFSFPAMKPSHDKTETEDAANVEAQIEERPQPPVTAPEASPAQRRSFNRNRVGFSDTLEFIPRPLSVISSDTSSTVTVRPGHSVSGSISSIISISNSVIEEKDEAFAPLELTPSQGAPDSRPSTAGAVLERALSPQPQDCNSTLPKRRGSLPLLTDPLPPFGSADSPHPSPTKAPKRWSFFGLEPFVGSHSPTKSRPVSTSSSEILQPATLATGSSERLAHEAIKELPPVQRMTSRKAKKQKKVKTWAGTIVIRKPKLHHHKKGKKASRRAPTPPPPRNTDVDEESVEDSADTTSEPAMPTVLITELATGQEGIDTWKPPRPATEDDTSYPMIDLDAALGPFNTPMPRNPEWEAAQKASGLAKRQLHSAAGMSRFVGPGMHYVHHQRAQSSPEMAPFEGRRGMQRFGSSSTMADVFEEDEEEDEEDSDSVRDSGKSTPQAELTSRKGSEASSFTGYGAGSTTDKKTDDDASVASSRGVKRNGADNEDDKKSYYAASMKSQVSLSSLQEQVIEEEPPNYPFRTVEFERSASRLAPDSPMSSPISPRGRELAPVAVSAQGMPPSSAGGPGSPYSATPSSSFPSPSPRSPVSYDANIISTAPSSVTEDSFQSLLMGEPGPEVRLSCDIPSLTSSNSTMTRESMPAQQAAQGNRAAASGERPASFSISAPFGGRRGSLASLSRLISSSHGERSKLSMEVTYNSDSEKKSKEHHKGSKSRRFSRMMQFWKPKDHAEA